MTEIRSDDYFAIVPEWLLTADISSNADRIACRLGVHPANIWPEYWSAGMEGLDD